jgi:hypothetical protein
MTRDAPAASCYDLVHGVMRGAIAADETARDALRSGRAGRTSA